MAVLPLQPHAGCPNTLSLLTSLMREKGQLRVFINLFILLLAALGLRC